MTFNRLLYLLFAASPVLAGAQVAPPPPPSTTTSDSVVALVNRYVAWRGGAAYQAVTSVHEKGQSKAAGMHGTFERYTSRDGRERLYTVLGDFKSSSSVSPAGSWTGNQGVIQDMDSASATDTRRMIMLRLPDALAGLGGATVTELPDEKRDGRSWAVLRVVFAGPDTYDAFIDRATGELLGWRVTQNRARRFQRLGDWRMVQGVRMPFRTENLFNNSAQNTEQHDDMVRLNVVIADSLFDRPATIRMAHFAGDSGTTGAIPFTYYMGSQIYIAGHIADHPADLLLDSGAGITVIDKAYADVTGIRTVGSAVVNGVGGQAGMSFARDIPVRIGNMVLRIPSAAVVDLSGMEKVIGRQVPMILGADVFQQLMVDIDFANHTVAFDDPATFTVPGSAVVVPLRRGRNNPSVPVRIEDGPELQMEFDIGNNGTVLVFPSYWQTHPELQTRKMSAVMGAGVGGMHEARILSLRSLTFAGHTFHDVPAQLSPTGIQAVNSDRTAGNLGILLYSRFRMITDYPHDRLYMIPRTDSIDAPFPRSRSGMSAMQEGNTLRVLMVVPGSPAAESGWKAGDIITAINGHPIPDSYVASELARWSEGKPGTKVLLTLASGKTRELILEDLY